MARKRITAAERERRIELAQTVYSQTLSTTKSTRIISQQLGVTRAVAKGIMAQLRERWNEESREEGDKETRRNQLREGGRLVYQNAMRRRVVQHNADGSIALYPKGHAREGKPIVRETPDVRHAIRALEFLAKLDGLFEHKSDDKNGGEGLVEAIDSIADELGDFDESSVTVH